MICWLTPEASSNTKKLKRVYDTLTLQVLDYD